MTQDKAAPGLWMTVAAVCGLVATLAIYQRKTPLAIEAAAPA
jgi:MHS family citrate/tricarballylate:H+ symporter-like MFS transporter